LNILKGGFLPSFFINIKKRISKMKTFSQFCREATRLDKEINKTTNEFQSRNLMQKIRAVEKMKKLEAGTGVTSLVRAAD
jgi:hypothetical protein